MQRVREQPKNCEQCGAIMYRKRFRGVLESNHAFNLRKFCSLSCANTKEELTKHGYSWRARKHLGLTCESCGSTVRLQAHHINQNIKDNRPENIQTLCKPCHDFWHSTAKRRGWSIAGRMGSLAWQRGFPSGWTDLEVSETP